MSAVKINRWFVRCFDCCSVVAIETDPMASMWREGQYDGQRYVGPTCSCGGQMTSMGRVGPSSNGLVLEVDRCACDSRCTSASGPSCGCSCGGKNHGTGRVVTIAKHTTGIPIVQGGSIERANEYREACTAARRRIAAQEHAREFYAVRRSKAALADAQSLKTHKRRMEALARVAA